MAAELQTELEQDLHAILHRRDATFGGLLPWLSRAGGCIVGGETGRITVWGMRVLRLVMDALIVYARDNGTVPDEVLTWLDTVVVPTLLGPEDSISAAEQELLRSLLHLYVRSRKKQDV